MHALTLAATITTNIAANVVAPANALLNFSPSKFTFRRGDLLNYSIANVGILSSIPDGFGFIYNVQCLVFQLLLCRFALLASILFDRKYKSSLQNGMKPIAAEKIWLQGDRIFYNFKEQGFNQISTVQQL
jgi:hypothetical protein